MNITQFISETDSDKRTDEHDAWTSEIGLPLTESLVVETYAEVVLIVSNNILVNFFNASESFGVFLNKVINGEKIGTLISKDKPLFKSLCKSWIFPSDLMEFADDNQYEDCAKYIFKESLENISYEEPKLNTSMKYCINFIKDGEYSKNVSVNLARLCESLIVDDTRSQMDKYIKSLN